MIFDEFTLKSQIRAVPDFPKPGVVFRDITPLFQSPRALRMTVDSFVQRYIEADFQPHRRHGCPRLPHRLGGGLCAEQAAGPVPQAGASYPPTYSPRATRPNTARPSSKYMPTASAKATAY